MQGVIPISLNETIEFDLTSKTDDKCWEEMIYHIDIENSIIKR